LYASATLAARRRAHVNSAEEKRETIRLLGGLENGGMDTEDAFAIARNVDPVLASFVIRFLRENYPASDPAATSVLDRVLKLMSTHPEMVAHCKKGEEDSVTEWFESEYTFRSFRGRGPELIEFIAEKLDS
jgi:hypothetical protein